MNNAITETASWKTQYQVTFSQSGLDSSAGSNTVLTVGSTTYAYNALPSGVWVDSGTTFSWSSTVSGGSGKQFALTGHSGLASPIAAGGTDTATYKTQFKVTFTASSNVLGDSSATIITVDGSGKAAGALPFTTDWIDSGATVTWAFSSTVTSAGSPSATRYSWDYTNGLGQTLRSNTFTVTGGNSCFWNSVAYWRSMV
jgi:hypothetical protein